MSKLGSDEIAIRRDLFNGLVDELMDALGWLLVIREENADVLEKACGRLDVEQRLMQMGAILSGRLFDKRYEVEESFPNDSDCIATEEQEKATCDSANKHERDRNHTRDPEAWKPAVEEKKDEDSHNTRG